MKLFILPGKSTQFITWQMNTFVLNCSRLQTLRANHKSNRPALYGYKDSQMLIPLNCK